MTIPWPELPGASRLAADYVAGRPDLLAFYAGPVDDPPMWRAQAAALEARPAPRDTVAQVIREQLQGWNAPPAAMANADLLRDPRSVVLITGQQAGLFGGPLLTWHKAMTVAKWAPILSAALGRPVVPVFWIDGDDHDFAEIQRASILTQDQQVQALIYAPAATPAATPAAALVIESSIEEPLTALDQATLATEFKPGVLDALKECYRPGRTLVDAFGAWMVRLLGHRGLVVVNPSDPRLKALVAPLFRREIMEAPASGNLAAAAGERLTALGYHAQVMPPANQASLFMLEGPQGPRRAILCDGPQLHTRGDGGGQARTAVAERLSAAPELFSPSVVLRPAVESALFPVLAYVAGPSELAYLGQLKSVYEAFGVPMPLVRLRAGATLVEPRVARLLDKYRLSVPEVWQAGSSLARSLAKRQIPPNLEEMLIELRGRVAQEVAGVTALSSEFDPNLAPTLQSIQGKILHQLTALEEKILQAARRKGEDLGQQVERLLASLMPGGSLQERVLCLPPFLMKFGWGLMDRIWDALDVDAQGLHAVVTLS